MLKKYVFLIFIAPNLNIPFEFGHKDKNNEQSMPNLLKVKTSNGYNDKGKNGKMPKLYICYSIVTCK